MGVSQMDRSPRTATRDYDRDMDDSDDDLALDYSPEAALYTRGADGIALSPRGPQAARRPDDDDDDDNEKGGLSVYVTIHRYGLQGMLGMAGKGVNTTLTRDTLQDTTAAHSFNWCVHNPPPPSRTKQVHS